VPSLYGISISVAIVVCLFTAGKLFPAKKERVWDLSFYAILFGIVGARLYHVIDYWYYYSTHLINIFQIWNGGLGIWGAVVGGLAGIAIYSRKTKSTFLENTDIIASVMPLGQAIGRWGNFFNLELLGKQSSLPWSINGKHPIFFYESILDLVLFLFLFKQVQRHKPTGHITYMYLAGYGIIRFFLEFLRLNPWKMGNLNVAQMLSILSIVTAIYLIGKGKEQ
jgi:phosphatidylglycerol:prolipoprotein diacylglycerol transferase